MSTNVSHSQHLKSQAQAIRASLGPRVILERDCISVLSPDNLAETKYTQLHGTAAAQAVASVVGLRTSDFGLVVEADDLIALQSEAGGVIFIDKASRRIYQPSVYQQGQGADQKSGVLTHIGTVANSISREEVEQIRKGAGNAFKSAGAVLPAIPRASGRDGAKAGSARSARPTSQGRAQATDQKVSAVKIDPVRLQSAQAAVTESHSPSVSSQPISPRAWYRAAAAFVLTTSLALVAGFFSSNRTNSPNSQPRDRDSAGLRDSSAAKAKPQTLQAPELVQDLDVRALVYENTLSSKPGETHQIWNPPWRIPSFRELFDEPVTTQGLYTDSGTNSESTRGEVEQQVLEVSTPEEVPESERSEFAIAQVSDAAPDVEQTQPQVGNLEDRELLAPARDRSPGIQIFMTPEQIQLVQTMHAAVQGARAADSALPLSDPDSQRDIARFVSPELRGIIATARARTDVVPASEEVAMGSLADRGDLSRFLDEETRKRYQAILSAARANDGTAASDETGLRRESASRDLAQFITDEQKATLRALGLGATGTAVQVAMQDPTTNPD